MGGKKGGSKVQVTQYSMSIHFGICAKVDALRRLSYGEKTMWSGLAGTNQTLTISQPNLFGGDKKEGGVSGQAYVLLGGSDQVLPDELANRLGINGGQNAPGFRGLTTIFFTGLPPAASIPTMGFLSSRGFTWTANTPYLRDLWATVDRFPSQLNSATAKIPRASSTTAPPDVTQGNIYVGVTYTDAGGPPPALDVNATADPGWQTNFSQTASFGAFGYKKVDFLDIVYISDPVPVPMGVVSKFDPRWILRVKNNLVEVGIHSVFLEFLDALGGVISYFKCQYGVSYETKNIYGVVNASSSAPSQFDYLKISFTETAIVIEHSNGTLLTQIDSYPANIESLRVSGNGLTDTHRGYADFEVAVEGYTTFSSSDSDANPAHIIYECLTDAEWGMGESPTNIDIASFQQVAQTLYDEGFGLSMMWSAESTIEDFVNEVLGHINGVLYTNPRTGQFTLKLTRGDYDVNTLRVLTPDHAEMDSFTRKAWGETTNEMKVTWTNPDSEQPETVTLQDLGNIAMQGAVVSNSVNYYGIRTADLAMTVCARDLRSSSAPLCACEMSLDRTAWDVAPMDVVKVTYPEYGLNELVMRVTSIDYGSIGEGTIRISLFEDVFSLPTAAFVSPPKSSWTNPVQKPVAVSTALVLPAPYFGLSEALGADVSAIEDPDTFAVVLAAAPTPSAASYDLASQITTPSGNQEWAVTEYARPFVGYGTLEATLPAEPKSFMPALTVAPGMLISPGVDYLVVLGGANTAVADIEFALVNGVDEARGAFTLLRGILDTYPREWPIGTSVWFGPPDDLWADPTKRLALSTAKYRLLTNSGLGQLLIDAAPDLTAVVLARASKPIRPADVRAAGVRGAVIVDSVASPTLALSWATRNRLTEDSQVLSWLDASVPPEDGATTSIDIANLVTGAALPTIDGLSGDSCSLDLSTYFTEVSSLPLPAGIRLSLRAKRGEEDSWSAGIVDVWRGVTFACSNPGAEDGNTGGWTITGPGSVSASTVQHHSGSRAFVGAPGAGTAAVWMTQDVPIPSFYQGDVDHAYLFATPSAWIYNYARDKNYTDIGVAVIDAEGVWRGGRMVRLDDYASRWQAAVASLPIPFEGRTLRIAARMRLRTSVDQCFVDDFQPAFRMTDSVCYDLFAHGNPADTGWSATGATLGSSTDSGDAGWGLPSLTAVVTSSDNTASFSRDIAIQDGALPGVDSGDATLRYTAALSTLTTVGARLKVEFRDGLGAILSAAYSRGAVGPTTLGEMEYDEIDYPVPAGTRVVRIGAELAATAPNAAVAARFNWITAQLIDASGNQYVDRNTRVTEDGEERVTEAGESRIIDASSVRDGSETSIRGLVSYYALDETAGITAIDRSGHGLTGTYQGTFALNGPSLLPSGRGRSARFGPSAPGNVLLPSGFVDAQVKPPFTFFSFIKLNSLAQSPQLFVSAYGGISLYVSTAGKLTAAIPGVSNRATDTRTLTAGVTYAIALTVAANGDAYFYVGKTGSAKFAAAFSSSNHAIDPFWLGAYPNQPTINRMDGWMQKALICNVDLTAQEISDIIDAS